MHLLDPQTLDYPGPLVHKEPFPFLIASDMLSAAARNRLDEDFPRYPSAGFFPHEPDDCGASINALIEALTAPAFAHAIGTRPGQEPLASFPTLVAICRSLNKRHGTIHTDSRLQFNEGRRVVQVAWLISEHEKLRKTQRGRLSRLFKKLFGAIDRRIGAGRKNDAAHLD